jgi:hypothetical protein
MRPQFTQRHGEKINVITGYMGQEGTTTATLFVGDTSPNITIYTVVS